MEGENLTLVKCVNVVMKGDRAGGRHLPPRALRNVLIC